LVWVGFHLYPILKKTPFEKRFGSQKTVFAGALFQKKTDGLAKKSISNGKVLARLIHDLQFPENGGSGRAFFHDLFSEIEQ